MNRPQHASLTLAEARSLSALSFEELWLRVLDSDHPVRYADDIG